MYAEHFKVVLCPFEKGFGAKTLCRYCNENQFITKEFSSEKEAWKDMKIAYTNANIDEGKVLDLHLMVCKEYGKFVEGRERREKEGRKEGRKEVSNVFNSKRVSG